ncbi:MAG: hypothetical protein JNL90_20230 [Planctomycetes bacterium]|nr:hypothetical protein [Planctomycetota bacterium]
MQLQGAQVMIPRVFQGAEPLGQDAQLVSREDLLRVGGCVASQGQRAPVAVLRLLEAACCERDVPGGDLEARQVGTGGRRLAGNGAGDVAGCVSGSDRLGRTLGFPSASVRGLFAGAAGGDGEEAEQASQRSLRATPVAEALVARGMRPALGGGAAGEGAAGGIAAGERVGRHHGPIEGN